MQPCSDACPSGCVCVCLLPCCSPPCQVPRSWNQPVCSSTFSPYSPDLLSYLLAAGRTPHNPSSIGLHKHPLHPGGEEVTFIRLRGDEGPPWPLLWPLPVGHMLVHQCGHLQLPGSSCSFCAGVTHTPCGQISRHHPPTNSRPCQHC